MSEIELEKPAFEFTGGHLSLDFVNTVHDRLEQPRELLNSYNDLLLWGQQARILNAGEAERLREIAAYHKEETMDVLRQAIDIREMLYRIFLAIAEDDEPDKTDLAAFNTVLAQTMAHARIVPGEDGFAWSWDDQEQALDRVLWPVVRSAADLLTSHELKDVRVCAAEDCGWLFLDTSKNHSRRWCDMKTCGNRAKARKHYTQKKRAS